MKKFATLVLLTFALLFALAPVVALAEGDPGGGPAAYTWAMLGTIAGATAATLLIVQFIKAPLDKVGHIPTRLLVYTIAFLILLGAQTFNGGTAFTWSSLPLVVVNAFVVALAAMGAYENTFARRENTEPPD